MTAKTLGTTADDDRLGAARDQRSGAARRSRRQGRTWRGACIVKRGILQKTADELIIFPLDAVGVDIKLHAA